MQDKQQIHAIIHGRVQGVSFRYYTMQRAEQLGCKGWVRNNRDGTVECVAQGNKEQLETLIAFLHEGSPYATVTAVNVDWETPTKNFHDFRVVYI